MAKLTENRPSHVETVSDWPRGTRRRKWGVLHDQIWFPCQPSEFYAGTPASEYMRRLDERTGLWHFYRLYMDRRMLWMGPLNLRLHTFYQGDDDSAPHDHPWWFVTFPLTRYAEVVQEHDPFGPRRDSVRNVLCIVRPFRLHFRRATHRHYVLPPESGRRIRTVVLAGAVRRNWGFWPPGGAFVPHRDWTDYDRRRESRG